MEHSTAEISVRAADGRKPFLRQCEDKIASFLSAWLYTDGSALLFQDLGCPRLLGIAQIELHGKPAQVFFIPHSIHLPEWDTR